MLPLQEKEITDFINDITDVIKKYPFEPKIALNILQTYVISAIEPYLDEEEIRDYVRHIFESLTVLKKWDNHG